MVGIDVVIVAPGSVATATWDKAEAMPREHLAGTIWERPFGRFTEWMIRNGRRGLSSEQVGTVIADALTVARPRTRYAPMEGKFMNATVPSLLPRRVLDRLIGQQLGLRPGR